MSKLEKALYADVCWLKQQLELQREGSGSTATHAAVKELSTTVASYLKEREQEIIDDDEELLRAAENLYAFVRVFGTTFLTNTDRRSVGNVYEVLRKHGSSMPPPAWKVTQA